VRSNSSPARELGRVDEHGGQVRRVRAGPGEQGADAGVDAFGVDEAHRLVAGCRMPGDREPVERRGGLGVGRVDLGAVPPDLAGGGGPGRQGEEEVAELGAHAFLQ
jgi:hypothetical protein